MFNDKIDYANPEALPYSTASTQEIIYSWIHALVFIVVVLVLAAVLD